MHSMGKRFHPIFPIQTFDPGLKLCRRVIFDNITNPFVRARAIATRSIVPGAIYKTAQKLPNGPQSTFDLANGFLDPTTTLYVSTSPLCIYFHPSYMLVPN